MQIMFCDYPMDSGFRRNDRRSHPIVIPACLCVARRQAKVGIQWLLPGLIEKLL